MRTVNPHVYIHHPRGIEKEYCTCWTMCTERLSNSPRWWGVYVERGRYLIPRVTQRKKIPAKWSERKKECHIKRILLPKNVQKSENNVPISRPMRRGGLKLHQLLCAHILEPNKPKAVASLEPMRHLTIIKGEAVCRWLGLFSYTTLMTSLCCCVQRHPYRGMRQCMKYLRIVWHEYW